MTNTLGIRMNSFSENFSTESEQDATSILTELDKGLRSTKIGEQCEAIVRFPKIFEKYPFPILINSSFLKLAEFFRVGSNLLRLWVLRVCQQSEKHTDKIINVDEFVRRVFMVIHSNDPIARALTLRTLGAVAGVIPEKQQVHHAIRRALDSHDIVEIEAAIDASVLFAAQSKTFAISMCSKVASMIESLQTPIKMKLQLIPVLKHMHHDANTAALVKSLCRNLLPKYPSEDFVVVILNSLTQLSCATLVDIPDQVTLLLTYLKDPRKGVRYSILHSMRLLALKGAHLWPKGALQTLLTKAMHCNDMGDEQSLVLNVVLTLTECPVSCNQLLNDEQNIVLDLCTSCLVLEHHAATSKALGILTKLVTYCYTERIPPPISYVDQIDLHIESLIYVSMVDVKLEKELKNYLKCGVTLSQYNQDFRHRFLDIVGGLLTDNFVYPSKHLTLLCETLGALGSQYMKQTIDASFPVSTATGDSNAMEVDEEDDVFRPTSAFHEMLPKLLKKLDAIASSTISDDQVPIVETLSAVCLQSMLGTFLPVKVWHTFDRVLKATNHWTQYRIARSASRYGHHYLAAIIYERLSPNVSLEKLHFFLSGLGQISKAECILNYGCEFETIDEYYKQTSSRDGAAKKLQSTLTLAERLESAVSLYWKALATLKASSSTNHPLTFQTEFVRLRGQFLEAMFNLVIIKNTQSITPPPIIAQTLAQNSRDYLQKFGHVTNQLRKAVKILKTCEDSYLKLYKFAFDADPSTLEYLEINQHACAILSYSVETICFVSPSEPPNTPSDGSYPETKYLLAACRKIQNELTKYLPPEQNNQKTITNRHTELILNQLEVLMQMPICMPRFFFQVLQNTSIKLSISPQPRITGDPVIVQPGSSLVVKVEGVIQHHGKTPSLYRSVDSVQLTLTSQLISPKPTDFKMASDTITLTQVTTPHRDFLTMNFMVPLNNIQPAGPAGQFSTVSGGQWQVTLEACVIDGDSVVWNTGPKSQLLVRVPEDTSKQMNTVPIRRF